MIKQFLREWKCIFLRDEAWRMVKIKIQAILFHDNKFIHILIPDKLQYKSVLVVVLRSRLNIG